MAAPGWNVPQRILHRALVVAAAAILFAASASAQRASQRKKTTPRALALVEWPAKGAPRLLPVCILIDGRYYDAGIYMADPVPMSLDSGNVYEVEHSGDPEGFFTVNEAQQVNDSWIGIGGFKPMQSLQTASAPAKSSATPVQEKDEPPKLHRGGKPEAQPQSAPPPNPPAQTQKPPEQAPPADQPPTLKRPESPAPAAPPQASAAPQPSDEEADPNRPRLRRGKPAATAAEETVEPPKSAVTASAAPKASAATPQNPAAVSRVLPAISDAKGPEPRSYLFDWTPQEQQKITRQMQDAARTALEAYLKGRPETAGPLQDVQVKAFDLDLSNEPVLVLTATAANAPSPPRRSTRAAQPQAEAAPLKPVTFYVTLVARQDFNGNLHPIFRRITDSAHLDAYARLELIDAVDVDGDGRAELFFRAINDQSRAFVIYRAGPDTLTELYNSGELER